MPRIRTIFGVLAHAWRIVIERISRAIVRVLIWGVAIAIAFYPVLEAADVEPLSRPAAIAGEINQKGYFADLFFVSIVVSVLSMTNLWDNMIRRFGELGPYSRVLATVGMCFQWIYLIYGMGHFAKLAHARGEPVGAAIFYIDCKVLGILLAVGVLTEIMIAFTDQ